MVKLVRQGKECKLAIASIFLAIFGLSLPAIICGHISILELRNTQHAYALTTKRMAIGGLIFGYIGLLIWLYLGLLGAAVYFKWDLKPIFPYGF